MYYEQDKNDITMLEQKLIDNVNAEDRILDFIKEFCVIVNQLPENERELAYNNFMKAIVKIILEDFESGEGKTNNANSWKNTNKKEKISVSSLYHRIFADICMNYVCLNKKNDILTFQEPSKEKI